MINNKTNYNYKKKLHNKIKSKRNNKNINKKGGFLFNFFGNNNNEIPTYQYGKYMGTAIKTENKLIKNYEAYAKASQAYYEAYKAHIKSIEDLEDVKNITSLLSTFKDTVLPNDFKYKIKIDRTNPLLLRNYLVTDDTLPKNFKKEHVLNQIRYIISRFKPSDKILIDSVGNLRIDGTSCYYTIKASNGEKLEKSVRINNDYIIDAEEVESQITEIISNLKSKIDFEIELINDFEVGENLIDVPGLAFADPEDILQAKLKEIKGSVKAEAPITFNNNNNKTKPKHKPDERVIYSIGPKTLKKREIDKSIEERNIGEDVKLNPNEFKQEPQPEIADQLKKIFNPDIQQPDMTQQQGQQQGNQQDQQQGQQQIQQPFGQQPQLQQQFPMQRNFDSPIFKPQPFLTVDPIEQQCRTMSNDAEKCKTHPLCYYSAHLEPNRRCHKDVKALNIK